MRKRRWNEKISRLIYINKIRSVYSITKNSLTNIKYTELILQIYFPKVLGPEDVKSHVLHDLQEQIILFIIQIDPENRIRECFSHLMRIL